MDEYDYEAQALAAENEAPYPWYLRLKLRLILIVGWIAQRFGLAVLLLALCALWPATVSADTPHHVITPQVSTVLKGNAPGTVYCPTCSGKVYAYTAKTNTCVVGTCNATNGMQFKTQFQPSAKLDYVTRNVYAENVAAGVNPVKAASAAKGFKTLAQARQFGLSIGAGGGHELDR